MVRNIKQILFFSHWYCNTMHTTCLIDPFIFLSNMQICVEISTQKRTSLKQFIFMSQCVISSKCILCQIKSWLPSVLPLPHHWWASFQIQILTKLAYVFVFWYRFHGCGFWSPLACWRCGSSRWKWLQDGGTWRVPRPDLQDNDRLLEQRPESATNLCSHWEDARTVCCESLMMSGVRWMRRLLNVVPLLLVICGLVCGIANISFSFYSAYYDMCLLQYPFMNNCTLNL